MIVLEVIFFAAMILLSIVFIYQLSPQSYSTEVASSALQTFGDDALRALYLAPHNYIAPLGYPNSTIEHYFITNSYGSLVSDLQRLLSAGVMFNLYISNESSTYLWCTSNAEYDAPLQSSDPVANCHCYITLDPAFSNVAKEKGWYDHVKTDPRVASAPEASDVFNLFGTDTTSRVFLVTLEIWRG